MKVELKLPVVVALHQDREKDEVPSGSMGYGDQDLRGVALAYVITSLARSTRRCGRRVHVSLE